MSEYRQLPRVSLKVFQKKGIKLPIPVSVMKGIAMISEGVSSITKKPALINNQKIIDMEQDFWTCSPDKAKKVLGFEAEINLENGIRETLIWYKEHKWL